MKNVATPKRVVRLGLQEVDIVIDWSEHKLTVESCLAPVIHTLARPEVDEDKISFVNIANHGLLVTGKWGYWAFNRQFIPSAWGSTNPKRWVESLVEANNIQDPYALDREKLTRLTERMVARELSTYRSGRRRAKVARFAEILKGCESVDDVRYALVHDRPSFISKDLFPNYGAIEYPLLAVFAAFDEICRRLGDLDA